MKQPSDSLFFQSQLFIAELCEPISYMDFLEEEKSQLRQQSSTKLEKMEKLADTSSKSWCIVMPKGNPYRSGWANTVLKDQFGVELTQVSQRYGTKWVIKRLKDTMDTQDSKIIEKKLQRVRNQNYQEQDLKSQEKFFRQTASKSNRKRLNQYIRNSQNGSIAHVLPKLRQSSEEQKLMPVFDINFHKKIAQYNL